ATEQRVGADAEPGSCLSRYARVVAGKRAGGNVLRRRQYGPHDLAAIGEAEVDAEAIDGAVVLLGAVRTLEVALELLAGTEHEANAAGDPAGEDGEPDMCSTRRPP